jgi:hypothetical protein
LKTHYSFLSKFVYIITLIAVSGYVLIIFVRPVENGSSGINFYYRSKFLDMVHGTAHKPFVYRTLLPSTVRLVAFLTPREYYQAFTNGIGTADEFVFNKLGWETSAAYEYFIAVVLMLLCFMGFAHYSAKLVMLTCNLGGARKTRLILAVCVLLGLPAFFKYTSYLYDPSQLLLFTMALYFLAASRLRAFVFVFILCCINKETAVFLLPVYALTERAKGPLLKRHWSLLLGLLFVYLVIKSLITNIFGANPGPLVDFQMVYNFDLLTRGWTFTNIVVLLVFALFLFHRWSEKPAFLKISLLTLFPLLIGLGLLFGFMDEWRIYYEVYPVAFGLAVDSFLRFKNVLDARTGIAQYGNPV